MSTIAPTTLLRPSLLDGCAALLACPPSPSEGSAQAVQDGLEALGSRVLRCAPDAIEKEEAPVDAVVAAALAELGAIDLLIFDGAGLFAAGLAHAANPPEREDGAPGTGGDATVGHAALRACLDAAWNVTRAVVNIAFLAAPVTPANPRRVVYLAPAPNAGEHAPAARAGLENLARTLSVEWARHAINVVTIAPGVHTAAEEVAAITAYLASPAGNYFTGCLLDLGGSASR